MAATEKKVKAPTKPKKTAAKPKIVMEKATGVGPTTQQIAELAHRFWAERGGHHGWHEHDWLRAEQELRGKAS